MDWIKGVMMLCIIITHSGTLGFVHHGYLAVNVFFVIAGFHLMRGFVMKPKTAIQYTWARFKQFFLPYILVFGFTCLLKIHGLTHFSSFDAFLDKYAQLFFSASLLEEAGPRIMGDHILWGSWFLSSLLIGGYLLYSMLEYNRKLSTRILFPAIVVLGYSFLYSQGPEVTSWSRVGAIGLPLLRSLCGLAAGALLYDCYHEYRPAIERRSLQINLLAIASFILFVALLIPEAKLDKYVLMTLPWLVLGVVINGSWLNKALKPIHGGLFGIVGRNSLYVLLVQEPAILLVHWSNSNLLNDRLGRPVLFLLDLLATFTASILLYYVCRAIKKKTGNA